MGSLRRESGQSGDGGVLQEGRIRGARVSRRVRRGVSPLCTIHWYHVASTQQEAAPKAERADVRLGSSVWCRGFGGRHLWATERDVQVEEAEFESLFATWQEKRERKISRLAEQLD